MAAPVPLRPDFDAEALRALAKSSRDPDQTRRLLALSAIYAGGSRSEAAALGGVGLQTVRDWVLAFNADGPDGLIGGNVWPAPSARCVWMAMRSASTYPVSGLCPGQDGYPCALDPHKAFGVEHRI